MGTASLVFGLGLIGIGLVVAYNGFTAKGFTETDVLNYFVGSLILSIPAFVLGGLLLRKYDRDKKKEKKLR